MKYTIDEVLNLAYKVFHQELPKIIEQERQMWEAAKPENQESGSCFECGSVEQCHRHHVVPQSLGGRNTILLCEGCHSKVHGLNLVNHSVLVRAGQEKARREGRIPGRRVGSGLTIERLLEKHKGVVQHLLAGASVRNTAKFCDCSKGTVERVKKALAYDEPQFS